MCCNCSSKVVYQLVSPGGTLLGTYESESKAMIDLQDNKIEIKSAINQIKLIKLETLKTLNRSTHWVSDSHFQFDDSCPG